MKFCLIKLDEEARLRLRVMDAYQRMNPKNVKKLCYIFGVSRSWFYKWRKRYNPWRLETLKTRSRRPKKLSGVPWSLVMEVCSWKRTHPNKSHYYLYQTWLREGRTPLCSPKTIYNIWKRRGLIAQRKRRKRQALPLLRKVSFPGQLVQIDTKHLPNGYYQYTAIDRFSRWRYLQVFSQATMENSISFTKELLKEAPFSVKLIQTDNGPEFQSKFVEFLKTLTISHQYTWIHTPDQNGCVERSHRTDEDEFYNLIAWRRLSLRELNQKVSQWTHCYNQERLHFALGFQTPLEYLQSKQQVSTI